MDSKKNILTVMVAIVVMIAVTAFCVVPVIAPGNPGSGCTCDTKLYGTIHGGIYFEQQGWAQFNQMTKTFENVPSGIKEARVYTGFWQGSPSKGGYFNITVNGHLTATYKACDPCPQQTNCGPWQPQRCDLLNAGINSPWNDGLDKVNMHDLTVGCGVQFVSFNATPYIVPGTNTITVKNRPCAPTGDCYGSGWDGRIYLIALLVVYEDGSMPEITYWLNEGALYLEKGSDCDGPEDHLYASKYFNGTHVSNPTKVRLWSLGWPHVINTSDSTGGWTKFNTHSLPSPGITESYAGGYNEVLLRWNNIPTSWLSATSNLLEYYDPNPLYERAFAEVLIVEGPSNKPDLTVTDIKFPTVMRPVRPYTISATVTNQGAVAAGSFNVNLKAERGGTIYYNVKKTVSGLAAGASTDVSFTGVNLGAGCYNFTAVADCDGNINEANENNNELEECYQVDNVIVVNGNSGFEDLVSEGLATKVGGTYYIESLDITNCAGDGISIQNTDVPFVINNCVVHDCGGAGNGMFFNNVKNGKVTDSDVRGNSLKGIKMDNCSYMTIDHNYVHDNLNYGVDVYLAHMPAIDSHHITITNNTLVKNLYGIELLCNECDVHENLIMNATAWSGGEEGWGIYVSGNDSKIYNNTIKWSDSYGIKVDNTWIPTSGNCIFGNNMIDNNQLHSHTSQAYDNGINYWNSTKKLGYYYGGTGSSHAFDHFIGSYWSGFPCIDGNNDGICDSQYYSIDGGTRKDYSPLKGMWPYVRIKCGDVNCDATVDKVDMLSVRKRWLFGTSICSDWAGNVNCDGAIDKVDMLSVRKRWLYGTPLNCCAGCT
ncbi:MAG: CARDB domain-containing protein [Halobacteriota archaeon]